MQPIHATQTGIIPSCERRKRERCSKTASVVVQRDREPDLNASMSQKERKRAKRFTAIKI